MTDVKKTEETNEQAINVRIVSPYGIPAVAKFEKVSIDEFKRVFFGIYVQSNKAAGNIKEDNEITIEDENFNAVAEAIYDRIELPRRISPASPDYYFFFPYDTTMLPAETDVVIPTGIKCYIGEGWDLEVHSTGVHENLRLVGSEVVKFYTPYFNNPDNEGHIILHLFNPSKDAECELATNQAFAAGSFRPYAITVDDKVLEMRAPEEQPTDEEVTESTEEAAVTEETSEAVEVVEGEVVE